jgi:hypothetical protein
MRCILDNIPVFQVVRKVGEIPLLLLPVQISSMIPGAGNYERSPKESLLTLPCHSLSLLIFSPELTTTSGVVLSWMARLEITSRFVKELAIRLSWSLAKIVLPD